jgi:thymidylate synthase ThyX
MAYLEQSTRYVPYTDRPAGRWKYHLPRELEGSPLLQSYSATLDGAFATYAKWLELMQPFYGERYPREEGVSAGAHKRSIRAKALDSVRGLLPAATLSNVGIFGTGQAYEALLLRMRAHPLAEVRHYAAMMLEELRKVIPAFLRRVDMADRGVRWSDYITSVRRATEEVTGELLDGAAPEPQPEVTLTDFDPEGEVKVVAAALYSSSNLPDAQLMKLARGMTTEERTSVLRAYVGERANRRHRPGRAFERSGYRFDLLVDYGAFRDLQRHRMLTLEWQQLSPDHGYNVSEAIGEAGGLEDWQRVMEESAALYRSLHDGGFETVAPYAVSMAYRIRFFMEMNAREAMHVIELRTTPQGHPSYRRVCQKMHLLIAEEAGHRAIADSMVFANHGEVELERLEAEKAAENRRAD